jgi:hypothetical protein
MCTEGFTSMMQARSTAGLIEGVSLSRTGTKLSHLLFADDSIVFMRASTDSCANFKTILEEYGAASRQLVNCEKSSVYFSSNIPVTKQIEQKNCLEIHKSLQDGKYLGLPLLIGRSKLSNFAFLRERVCGKLQVWQGKLLSMAGKEVLIKAVLQALPTYTMSVFKLPTRLCEELVAQNSYGELLTRSGKYIGTRLNQ